MPSYGPAAALLHRGSGCIPESPTSYPGGIGNTSTFPARQRRAQSASPVRLMMKGLEGSLDSTSSTFHPTLA